MAKEKNFVRQNLTTKCWHVYINGAIVNKSDGGTMPFASRIDADVYLRKTLEKIELEGISREMGHTAIHFVNFLEFVDSYNDDYIYQLLKDFCNHHKLTERQIQSLKNVVDMYIHKILRHKGKGNDE